MIFDPGCGDAVMLIRPVKKLAEIDEWLAYDIPANIAGQAWDGKYRGQTQKWYALAFTGADG